MASIFLSYRRDDSAGFAGRLADVLEAAFGADSVFRDVDDIRPGDDFQAAIHDHLQAVGAVLVIIGPRWLDARAAGGRRLDQADDFVRLEIAAALASGKPVIPVLVSGATMPGAADLPPALAGLARRQAVVLSDTGWRGDVERLVTGLRELLPDKAEKRPGIRRGGLILAGLAALALVAATLLGRNPEPTAPAGRAPAIPDATRAAPAVPSTPPVAPQAAGVRAEPCPLRLSINRDLPTPFTCACGPESMRQGAVWGTDDYTDDSGLCQAALHAGVIPAGGGTLTVVRGPGRPLYIGSSRNSVRSNDYGDYSHSIRFADTAASPVGPEPCPVSLSINPDLPTPFTCRCDGDAIRTGSVWGTDIYTDDSALCQAAVHAGVIGSGGGRVTVSRGAGRPLYTGSRRNGILSHDYGEYARSIRFQPAAAPRP